MKFEIIDIYNLDDFAIKYQALKYDYIAYVIDPFIDCIGYVPSKPVENSTLPTFEFKEFDPWFNPIFMDSENTIMMVGSCEKTDHLLLKLRNAFYEVIKKYTDCEMLSYRIIEPRVKHINEETGIISYDEALVFCDIGIANLEDRDMFISYINIKDIPVYPRCINPNNNRSLRSSLHLNDSQVENFKLEVLNALKKVFE